MDRGFTGFTAEDEHNTPQTMSVMRVRRSDGTTDKIASIVGYPYAAALGESRRQQAADDG